MISRELHKIFKNLLLAEHLRINFCIVQTEELNKLAKSWLISWAWQSRKGREIYKMNLAPEMLAQTVNVCIYRPSPVEYSFLIT